MFYVITSISRSQIWFYLYLETGLLLHDLYLTPLIPHFQLAMARHGMVLTRAMPYQQVLITM